MEPLFVRARWERTVDAVVPSWDVTANLRGPLWRIAHDAGMLVTSADVADVKECPGCGWLFLDVSRNRSRRWCDMATCGSRDKMRRYHWRRRVDS
ncbi:MAG: CGNR zinc finger domain-containing protein [Chloroflexota bacterium]|nr:CGNR zinc finger domain-containing protein [Chloroflexota bacterium]